MSVGRLGIILDLTFRIVPNTAVKRSRSDVHFSHFLQGVQALQVRLSGHALLCEVLCNEHAADSLACRVNADELSSTMLRTLAATPLTTHMTAQSGKRMLAAAHLLSEFTLF